MHARSLIVHLRAIVDRRMDPLVRARAASENSELNRLIWSFYVCSVLPYYNKEHLIYM